MTFWNQETLKAKILTAENMSQFYWDCPMTVHVNYTARKRKHTHACTHAHKQSNETTNKIFKT